jgi:hypothetical protein
MAKGVPNMLPRYTLVHNRQSGGWDLYDQLGEVVKRFARKSEETARGGLATIVKRGTVRIHSKSGRIEAERTFPRSEDPRRHPG